jgi:putative hemolysin
MIRERSLDIDLTSCVVAPLFVSEGMPTLKLLERFKQSGKHQALVVDEYGSTVGIVTLTDLLEVIVGDVPSEEEGDRAAVVTRDDGSLLIDGMLPISELADYLTVQDLMFSSESGYQTLGGFVMHNLGRVPHEGEWFEWQGYRFEVVDMDGRRVDKVLVAPC